MVKLTSGNHRRQEKNLEICKWHPLVQFKPVGSTWTRAWQVRQVECDLDGNQHLGHHLFAFFFWGFALAHRIRTANI
jgi:hypothetical protein